jgi:Holliday junction resolvase-like predicted endonuclease
MYISRCVLFFCLICLCLTQAGIASNERSASQEKQQRVEQAADLFIQRWHETLDMNVLFDEMYVSNAKQRSRNVEFFYGVYQFLTASGYGPAVDKDVDEKVLREGFMAFCNMFFLHDEYLLAYMESADEELKYPPDILAAGQAYRKLKLNPKRMTRAQVIEFAAKANNVSSVYRKHLPPEVFKSARYQKNLKQEQDDSDEDSKPFRLSKGFPEYLVGNDTEVYRLRRGVFDLYFVEEGGKLKVLTLGFEL